MAISNIEKGIKERIRYVLASHNKSISSIADDENERIALCRQIKRDETSISVKTVYKLLYALHDVDANWVILGEGQMRKTVDYPNIINHNEVNGSTAGGSINVGNSAIPMSFQTRKRIAELENDKKQLQELLTIFTSQAQSHKPKPKKQ